MGMMRGYMRRSMRGQDQLTKEQQRSVTRATVRRIFSFVAPFKKLLFLFVFLVIVDALVGVANPLVYRQIINVGILQKRGGLIISLALLIAVLALVDAGLTLWERYLSSRIGEGLIFDMRTKVFSHVQEMSIAFFTRTQTGALVSRLNNDVLGAQEAFTDVLSTVVGNLISVILTLGVMLVLSWQLTLIAIVLLPVFLFPARWIGRQLQAITRESYSLNAAMNTTMVERFNVAGALLVKLFGRSRDEDRSFEERAGRVRDIGVKQAMYARVFFVSLMLTASLATAIVYGWGGLLTLHGALSVGTLVALTAYLNRLYGPLTALSNINVDIMTSLVSFERVFEVLDLPPMVADREGATPLQRGTAELAFHHVDFRYPRASEVSLASLESIAIAEHATTESNILHDIDFVVKPGQLVALVGPSGAGKTTIGQLIPRLYDVVGGSITINGTDIRDVTLSTLRSAIGVVTQDAHLFHDTIRNNLLYASPGATDADLREALRGAQILPLVDSLADGLDTVVGDRGYRLSGGEKQRIAIARLLLKAPDIVVLDEATAHLDSESEVAVQEALRTALSGRTSVVIAHRLSTIRDADQILVIEHGAIVEQGTHDNLLAKNGMYAELYRTQFLRSQDNSEALSPLTNLKDRTAMLEENS
ncbi:MAG: ABC transporter ATP-binding protein [Candidatus Dormibacteria bacterium]